MATGTSTSELGIGQAHSEIEAAVIDVATKRGLSYAEILRILTGLSSAYASCLCSGINARSGRLVHHVGRSEGNKDGNGT